MDKLPAKREAEPEVIEPEIMGFEPPPPSLWRRFMARAVLGLALGAAGAALVIAGTVLTLTILGASVGIPLMILGLILLVAAFLLPMARGRIHVVSFRWPPR